jgi:hypothetical protein
MRMRKRIRIHDYGHLRMHFQPMRMRVLRTRAAARGAHAFSEPS